MAIFLFIFFLLLVCYALLIDFYRRSWNQAPEFIPGNLMDEPFISVIIPIRNEQSNLKTLTDSLKQQAYPSSRFEVIIVDDHSTDDSWNILQAISSAPIRIRSIKLADEISGKAQIKAHKKLAIEKGIDLAEGELIVTTDADCVFDPKWLSYIVSYYQMTKAKFI